MKGSIKTAAKLRPQAEKLLHIAKNIFAAKTFSKTLGTEAAELTFADQDQGVTFSMTVPERICLPIYPGSKTHVLPVSSAIAIFDDLSTYSFMIKDKNCRSGVSVILSAEILADVPPGSKIQIVSQVSKIGRSIGFSDVYMFNEKDELVARGYHTKYLPMGTAWDFLSHPSMMDASLNFYDKVFVKIIDTGIGKKLAKLMLGGRNRDLKLPDFLSPGSVFDSFKLKPQAAKEIVNIPDSSIKCKHTQEVVENNEFIFEVFPFMCNIRGFLHGGCVAMTIERALTASSIAAGSNGRVRRLDIQYLNGMKVSVKV
jgi:acyl-coenzyme A thioesterase PaaI-like protein